LLAQRAPSPGRQGIALRNRCSRASWPATHTHRAILACPQAERVRPPPQIPGMGR